MLHGETESIEVIHHADDPRAWMDMKKPPRITGDLRFKRQGNGPGHIGLISENHPGITADMQLGSLPLASTSMVAAEAPVSSSSLGLLTGKSTAVTPLSSAMRGVT